MKKLLIVGGKFSDIPTIKSARMLGYYVITSGNNPSDLGHNFSDETILCDYSDKDAILELSKDLKIDAIMSSCDDVSLLTCSYISDYLGIGNFDNFEISKTIHYKDLWREFLYKNSLNSPKAKGFSNVDDAISNIPRIFKDSKIIIKPVDFATGKGVNVSFANKPLYDIVSVAMQNSKSGRIIVEEFIDGSNHGFSTILQDQKVVFYFYDDEQHDFNPFSVSGTTTSQCFTSEVVEDIINQIETIARILNLKNGVFHTQIILHTNKAGNKVPYIVEACRRMGGDLYSEFVSQVCNIDYPSLCIQAHQSFIQYIFQARADKVLDINIKIDTPKIYQGGLIKYNIKKKYFARQCIMSRRKGMIKSIDLSLLENALTDSLVWAKQNDSIDDILKYKAGIVFLEDCSINSLYDKINLLPNCINLTS